MRVLHIMSGFGGGISMFIQNQAQGMVGQGISFDVATYDEVSQEFQAAIRRVDGQIHTMYNYYHLKNDKHHTQLFFLQ